MNRAALPLSLFVIATSPTLSGCVPMMAASAVGMVARSAQGTPVSNEALRPAARQACNEHAAQFGTVHIIDVVQERADRIVVWGTVEDATQKRSFQCNFGTKITGFVLRPIRR